MHLTIKSKCPFLSRPVCGIIEHGFTEKEHNQYRVWKNEVERRERRL